MTKQKRNAILFIVFYIVLFYSWIVIYDDDAWVRAVGASLLPVIAALISIYWLMRTFKFLSNKHRVFLWLLNTGLFLHLLSNLIWFVYIVITGEPDHPIVSFYIWISAYALFLTSLIYKLKLLYKTVSMSPFIFNIVIFMIAAITLSTHYLINPIIEISMEHQSEAFFNILYPIIDIAIAFVIINIYYMTRLEREKRTFFFLSFGFFIQIVTDTLYAFLLINNQYEFGSLIDPLWALAILVIGYSGFYVERKEEVETWEFTSQPKQGNNGLILNLSVIYLAILAMASTEWHLNVLIIGLILSIVAIVTRQIVMTKNHRLLLHDLWYHAYHDKLTGLHNRTSYLKDMDELINYSKEKKKNYAIMLLDFDRFKNINDTLGHGIGDQLLQECSIILKASISEEDRVYRVGGDEFIIITLDASEENCERIANTILNNFSKSIPVNNYQITITPSIGISLYPYNGQSSELLLRNADMSMYLAKSEGRNQYKFYSSELSSRIARKMRIENELGDAISLGQLSLYYQPKVDLQTREIVGIEALLRWKHPDLGYVSPDEFIPIAEETGLIVSIGDWVLTEACKQIKDWHQKGYDHLCMCVNVSVRQFQHKAFIQNIEKILHQTGVNPTDIELEITESIMQNLTDSTRILHELRRLGIKTSIDDFGTGYSSLSVLKTLPIDAIKVDRTFIQELSDKDIAMVKTIMNIGFNLDLEVVIEGIEDEEHINTLLNISDERILGQGYYFSKPLPPEKLESILQN
ncbi:EAL domain-containing protein [Ornithinibacillus scapharcae]|uniref:EAL domain-containing protein n=1 Tax=Ornithinibacillus scapharcae TaxID=1147159 RepID=UPI000225B08B|nr:EAL domain-containing protein [Ornithinibacillus scapharcae]